MKKSEYFLQSLEKYVYQVSGRSPLPWTIIGTALFGIVVVSSLLNVKNSMASVQNTREVIERAGERGDYATAKRFFEAAPVQENVLGAASELEDKVYPEKVVERKIADLENRLEQNPNHFEMLLELSRLNSLIDNHDVANEYREKARILDPNNVIFR